MLNRKGVGPMWAISVLLPALITMGNFDFFLPMKQKQSMYLPFVWSFLLLLRMVKECVEVWQLLENGTTKCMYKKTHGKTLRWSNASSSLLSKL